MRSKKYQEKKNKIDSTKNYSLNEALEFIKNNSSKKFDETVEVHIRLGIDASKTEQQVRGMVTFPHNSAKKKKIAVFVGTAGVEKAKKAGADLVGGIELIDEIKNSGKCDFDIAIAEPEMMKNLSQIAKILGPKGLMPNPKTETVTTDIGKTISELQKGKVSFKNDDSGNIHQSLGKASWPQEKIKENLEVLLNAIKKAKPASAKGSFIDQIYFSSTMGPGIKVQPKFFIFNIFL
jgi:large subunit ribosomal protein L1